MSPRGKERLRNVARSQKVGHERSASEPREPEDIRGALLRFDLVYIRSSDRTALVGMIVAKPASMDIGGTEIESSSGVSAVETQM